PSENPYENSMFVFRSTQGLKLTQARNQDFIWIGLAGFGLAWPGLDWGSGGIWIVLNKTAFVCVSAKRLKRPKLRRGGLVKSWRRFGAGAAPAWIGGYMPTVNAIRAELFRRHSPRDDRIGRAIRAAGASTEKPKRPIRIPKAIEMLAPSTTKRALRSPPRDQISALGRPRSSTSIRHSPAHSRPISPTSRSAASSTSPTPFDCAVSTARRVVRLDAVRASCRQFHRRQSTWRPSAWTTSPSFGGSFGSSPASAPMSMKLSPALAKRKTRAPEVLSKSSQPR